MVVKFDNLKPGKLHVVFPVIAPCDCHREEASARYNVRVIGNDKTRLVTNVFIKCTYCGESKVFDVALDKLEISKVKF